MQGCWKGLVAALIVISHAPLTGQAQVTGQAPANPATERGPMLISPGSGDMHQFTYKFQTGQFAHFEVSQKMAIKTQFSDVKEQVKNEQQSWKHYRVISVDDQGHAVLEPLIDRVKMSAQFGDADPVSYDSTKPEECPRQFRDIAATVGKPVARVTMTPHGELFKVQLLEAAPKPVTSAASESDPTLNFLIPFPKQPIGVGATWKDRFQVPVTVGQNGLTQPLTMQRQYELSNVSGSIATINLRTSVITPVSDPQIEAQVVQRCLSGVIEFDLERGQIVSRRTAMDRTVVGALGPGTTFQAILDYQERLIPAPNAIQPAALIRN